MLKRFFQVLLCGLLLSLLAGCGGPKGMLGTLPQVTAEDAGEAIVIRPNNFVGVANVYKIALEGNDLFGIASGEHTRFKLPEGESWISVKCFGGFSPTWKEESLKFKVEPGSKTYFLIEPSMSCASIEEIPEARATELMEKTKFVEMK